MGDRSYWGCSLHKRWQPDLATEEDPKMKIVRHAERPLLSWDPSWGCHQKHRIPPYLNKSLSLQFVLSSPFSIPAITRSKFLFKNPQQQQQCHPKALLLASILLLGKTLDDPSPLEMNANKFSFFPPDLFSDLHLSPPSPSLLFG